MTDLRIIKNKHLDLETRNEIQGCLDHGMTFKAIGRTVGKDQTTVSKEMKKHITVRASNYVGRNEQYWMTYQKNSLPYLYHSPLR